MQLEDQPDPDPAGASSGCCTPRSPRSSGRSSRRTSSSTSPTRVPGRARFRVNVYRQRDALGAAFRIIPFEIKPLEDLGVPPSVGQLRRRCRAASCSSPAPPARASRRRSPSLIDLANRTRSDHIMTVEDPIEFLHRHQKLPGQPARGRRGHHGPSQNALKHVLRQDPDIILVGEMRDLETISVALTAAETGHLVFATLHTQDAAQTIDRVIDVFPPHQQQQVRVQLAGALQGVVCQTLCQDRGRQGPRGRHRGPGRHPGDPQPDPRGQDPPDLLGDAGRRQARHAHHGPAPRRPGQEGPDHLRGRRSRSATTSRTSTGSPAEAERHRRWQRR